MWGVWWAAVVEFATGCVCVVGQLLLTIGVLVSGGRAWRCPGRGSGWARAFQGSNVRAEKGEAVARPEGLWRDGRGAPASVRVPATAAPEERKGSRMQTNLALWRAVACFFRRMKLRAKSITSPKLIVRKPWLTPSASAQTSTTKPAVVCHPPQTRTRGPITAPLVELPLPPVRRMTSHTHTHTP
jgi:hypothetical protein